MFCVTAMAKVIASEIAKEMIAALRTQLPAIASRTFLISLPIPQF
jgi:hypothetical protein